MTHEQVKLLVIALEHLEKLDDAIEDAFGACRAGGEYMIAKDTLEILFCTLEDPNEHDMEFEDTKLFRIFMSDMDADAKADAILALS